MARSSDPVNVVKLIRDLRRRKARERRGMVLAEGRRLVADALAGGAEVVAVLAAEQAAAAGGAGVPELLAAAQGAGAQAAVVSRAEFDPLCDTDTPSGVLAVVRWEPLSLSRLPPPPPRALALVLDAVQDPGNAGTMIRAAHALGAWCTIALDGTADVRGPKALRAAMGSTFRHRVAVAGFEEVAAFARAHGLHVLLAASDGAPAADTVVRERVALVVGSEGRGVRPDWAACDPRRVAVPMLGDAESLNAAVATGILLYELLRAR